MLINSMYNFLNIDYNYIVSRTAYFLHLHFPSNTDWENWFTAERIIKDKYGEFKLNHIFQ